MRDLCYCVLEQEFVSIQIDILHLSVLKTHIYHYTSVHEHLWRKEKESGWLHLNFIAFWSSFLLASILHTLIYLLLQIAWRWTEAAILLLHCTWFRVAAYIIELSCSFHLILYIINYNLAFIIFTSFEIHHTYCHGSFLHLLRPNVWLNSLNNSKLFAGACCNTNVKIIQNSMGISGCPRGSINTLYQSKRSQCSNQQWIREITARTTKSDGW